MRTEDYGNTPRGAIAYQRALEQAAFLAGGGGYAAPLQTVGDFLVGGHGTEPSKVLPSYMGGNVTLCDLDRETPALSDYDLVIVGGSVRFGKVRRATVDFLRDHAAELAAKPLGIYLCCGFGHEFEGYREKWIPEELRRTAFCVTTFGGTLSPENQSFFDKLLIRWMRSTIIESELDDGEYTPTLPGIP